MLAEMKFLRKSMSHIDHNYSQNQTTVGAQDEVVIVDDFKIDMRVM